MVVVWHSLRVALLMAWEVWWALVLGFAISAIVQAWVPREHVQRALGGGGAGVTARATLLGAASSSCSYGAVAIGKSLFTKGASAAGTLAFQIASTNLVWELGLVLWVLIGWQFTVAEYVGGIVMIGLMAVTLRLLVSRADEERARAHAQDADAGHHHHHHHHHHAGGSEPVGWRARLTSIAAWSDVADNFRGDWQMLWREIAAGFLLAGFIAQVPNHVFSALFLRHAPHPIPAVENALVGPLLAVASFVCSVGNVPLAAVLWSGGFGFAGVLAFLFGDLIVLPIIAIYRKYYGTGFALRISGLMYVTMVIAALAVAGLFAALGLTPAGPRPTRADIFGAVHLNGTLALNAAAAVVFAALWALTLRPSPAALRQPAGGSPHPARGE